MGLVNRAVLFEKLREETIALARKLMEKSIARGPQNGSMPLFDSASVPPACAFLIRTYIAASFPSIRISRERC